MSGLFFDIQKARVIYHTLHRFYTFVSANETLKTGT